MKVSINWIKDFVDLEGIDIEKLISKFTMGVAEVEGIEYKGKDISNVVTAKILSVEDVVNSKKLHLLKVDAGEKEPLQIVCGAPNVRVGLVTALAKIGAKLGDITINKAKLAGLDSFGMCCGGDEIGISDDHSGIVELDENTPIGIDIKKVLPMEDIVFEIDNKSLTNRPDLWGHYGIAREIAALTGRKLKELKIENESHFEGLKDLEIKVTSPDCYRYTSSCMSNITRKKSTYEMQIRLYYCGMRGINLLADVTNYVMLELGQPMHAFDGDVVKKIEVYNLKEDYNFTTLDSTIRLLKSGNMVIATNGTPVALAGIMGGENSEIKEDTTCVLIESANFDSYKVRTTAISLGMRTEASARYEKSLDPELTKIALLRYVYLIKSMDKSAKISSSICDIYNKHYDTLKINLTKEFVDKYVGIDIPLDKIKSILSSLEFKLTEEKNGVLTYLVPSFRATKDINGKADLVEEITRIYGYDNITPKSIVEPIKPSLLNKEIQLEYDTKYTLATRFDLNETHSYLWYDEESNKNIGIEETSVIRCINSISKENDRIRSTIIPSLLKVINENKKDFNSFGTFEIGRVVKKLKENNLADETKSLGVVLYSKDKNVEEELNEIKEILDYLKNYILKVDFSLEMAKPQKSYFSPKNYYKIMAGSCEIGQVFLLHIVQANNIEENCVITGFEIDFSKLVTLKNFEDKFEKISKYPTTKLDFNFLIPKDKLYKDIISIATSLSTQLNYSVSLLDIYENQDGTKSYTLHYEVNSLDRTLTNSDIEAFHSLVIEHFSKFNINLKL